MDNMMGLSPDMGLERRQDCACPFEGVGDAQPLRGPACFTICLDAFLQSRFNQPHVNDDVCRSLQESGGGDAFYPLYYLDKKWCGLVPEAILGQDPNVDEIINTCNGLNFRNLTDPGVPPQSYQCNLCAQPMFSAASEPTEGPVINLSATSTSLTTTEPTSTTSQVSATSSALSSIPTSSASSSARSTNTVIVATTTSPTTNTPEYSIPTTASTNAVSQSRNRLPTEAAVAIAVCTALAVIGAVLLLLCVLRRRKKQQDDYSSDMRSRISRIVQDFTIPPASSPQPLISPTQSYTNDRPPLTPPLRLRDRKLLPSLLRPLSRPESVVFGPPFDTNHSKHSSSSHYSSHSQKKREGGIGEGVFPASPIGSPPTYDKLESRQENVYQKVSSCVNSPVSLSPEPSSPPYTRLKSPPPVAFTFPPRSSLDNLHQCAGSPPRKGVSSSLRKTVTSTSTTSSEYNQDYYTNSRTNSTDTASTVVAAPPPPQQQQEQQNHPTAISSNPFAPTPPSSPVRPRRPHDEPLEIPDLVSPLTSMTTPASPSPGPPPNKALPPPPGSRRTSSMASDTGVPSTASTTPVPAATNTTGAGGARHSPGGISLRSLQGQHHRQEEGRRRQSGPGPGEGGGRVSQGSWGSWEDAAGDRSIVGVALSPPGRGAGTVCPPPGH